ncbi:MAG: hypothetical protein ABI183_12395 [Polyangiaceae bacterium]
MRRFFFVASIISSSLISITANADTLLVGPGKTYTKVCDAIAAARINDTIEVDASGNYDGENCGWDTDNLTITGVNGRPKINLTSAPSDDKGIFTITAKTATIENFEFSGATSSTDNGAGIRHQGLNLTVRGCYFHDNQDGILGSPAVNHSGTPQPGIGTVLVETSEFSHNGAGDGMSHNMYIGDYGSFTLRASYSHNAIKGQLVKSRAYKTFILYNRLTDEVGATTSYEVDIPNAGTTYVIGNLIEQSADSENDNIIETGAEGASNPTDQLFVVNNTVVNDQANGIFVDVSSGATVSILNNIIRGKGTITNAVSPTLANNWDDSKGDPLLVNQASYDYHLQATSPCVEQGKDPGAGPDLSLTPVFEYVHPTNVEGRIIVGRIDMGAYELNGGVALGDGGIDGVDSGTALLSDGGSSSPGSNDNPSVNGSPDDGGGCGCLLVGNHKRETPLFLSLGIAITFAIRRSRKRRQFVKA